MDVCYHYRTAGYAHSIERVFADVRDGLPAGIRQFEFICPARRAEPVGMLRNGLLARRAARQINHITGDVNYLAPFLPRRSVVITVHDVGHVMTLRGLKSRLYRTIWFDWPIRCAERVTFISEFSRQEAERVLGVSLSNHAVIPNPVSDRFSPSPKQFSAVKPTVLVLGTAANKNLPRLFEALEGLDVRLRIIGDLTAAQRDRLARHRVNFTSASHLSAEAVIDEYRRADIVALVSTYEGFGLPVIEGQAIGRPVLASKTGAIPEIAGASAKLVDPLSPRDIRAGLLHIINSPDVRADMVDAGYRNIRRFRAGYVAAQYFKLYEEIRLGHDTRRA